MFCSQADFQIAEQATEEWDIKGKWKLLFQLQILIQMERVCSQIGIKMQVVFPVYICVQYGIRQTSHHSLYSVL